MKENNKPSLLILCPCFNEMQTIKSSIDTLLQTLADLGEKDLINYSLSRILVVDDGSSDESWSILKNINAVESKLSCIKFSRNFGHQNALLAGLMNSEEDIVVSIDIDLQDDVNVIEKMVKNYLNGFEIVYGVKKDRSVDGAAKKLLAKIFYSFLSFVGVEVIKNHADFRLLSRKAINTLKDYKEYNLFLRGMIPMLGYKNTTIEYNLEKRRHGSAKYSHKKSLGLAINGITSFSLIPLRLIFVMGSIVALLSIIIAIYYLYLSIFSENIIPGWASTILPIYFLGSIQLIALGVISEYIGKLFLESKKRPNYTIEEILK